MSNTTTLTLEAFKRFANHPEWQRQLCIDEAVMEERDIDQGDDEAVTVPCAWRLVSLVSSLDGVTLRYTETVSYDLHAPDAFTTSHEGDYEIWRIDGLTVTDENGNDIPATELSHHLSDVFSQIGDLLRIGKTHTDSALLSNDCALHFRL